MPSKREQILTAVAAALAGTVGVGSRIYRSRVEAFARNEAPAIVVEPGQDRAVPYSICKLDWTLDVLVAVYARGPIPDQLADATIVSLHSKLMADRTLGGLVIDIIPSSVNPQFEAADQPAAWILCTYQVRYRTADNNITA